MCRALCVFVCVCVFFFFLVHVFSCLFLSPSVYVVFLRSYVIVVASSVDCASFSFFFLYCSSLLVHPSLHTQVPAL